MELKQDENLLLKSYLNCLFIASLKKSNFFDSEYFDKLDYGDIAMKQSLKNIGIDNQGMMLTFLYSMIVLPKELILKKYKKEFYELDKFIDGIKDSETKSSYDYDENSIKYVLHIRNAVSHGNVKFEPNEYVEFYDINKHSNKNEKCNIRIPLYKFDRVLMKLQEIFNKYIRDIQSRMK